MYTYKTYVDGKLYLHTADIVVHQRLLDRLHEAGMLEQVTEERIKND